MDADAAPTYPLGPALEFLQRLWRLDHALEKVSGEMERNLGVTAQQRLVVRCLGKYPGIGAGQLATLLHVDPSTISATLRRLERRALVERRRDPRDQRRTSLGLTARGRALDQATPGTIESAVQGMLDQSRADDVAATTRVLEQLTTRLENAIGARDAR